MLPCNGPFTSFTTQCCSLRTVAVFYLHGVEWHYPYAMCSRLVLYNQRILLAQWWIRHLKKRRKKLDYISISRDSIVFCFVVNTWRITLTSAWKNDYMFEAIYLAYNSYLQSIHRRKHQMLLMCSSQKSYNKKFVFM